MNNSDFLLEGLDIYKNPKIERMTYALSKKQVDLAKTGEERTVVFTFGGEVICTYRNGVMNWEREKI